MIPWNETKAMFLLLLAAALLSNLLLGRFASAPAVAVLCLLLYSAAWFLFLRADLMEYAARRKSPVSALCITALTVWGFCALLGAAGAAAGTAATVKGLLLMLLIYMSAPVVYLLLLAGCRIETVVMYVLPLFFGSVLLLRLLLRASLGKGAAE